MAGTRGSTGRPAVRFIAIDGSVPVISVGRRIGGRTLHDAGAVQHSSRGPKEHHVPATGF